MRSNTVLCLTVALFFLLPGCLGSDDRCATYGASQSVDFYAVSAGASGLIDASYSTEGENKTWNCCDVDVGYDDGVIGPISWSIVGYIFAIEVEDSEWKGGETTLNVSLHGSEYDSEDYPPRPDAELRGDCFLGTLTWTTHQGLFTHENTSYWGFFVEDNVTDFENGGDDAVPYEASISVEVFVVMKQTSSFA